MNFLYFSLFTGLFAVVYSVWQTMKILKLPKGTPDMIAIADAISEGAYAYLKRQYQVISIIAILIFIILWILVSEPQERNSQKSQSQQKT